MQSDHPNVNIEQFGGASANKAMNETFGDDLKSAEMLSLPVTLIILDASPSARWSRRACRCSSGSPR